MSECPQKIYKSFSFPLGTSWQKIEKLKLAWLCILLMEIAYLPFLDIILHQMHHLNFQKSPKFEV